MVPTRSPSSRMKIAAPYSSPGTLKPIPKLAEVEGQEKLAMDELLEEALPRQKWLFAERSKAVLIIMSFLSRNGGN